MTLAATRKTLRRSERALAQSAGMTPISRRRAVSDAGPTSMCSAEGPVPTLLSPVRHAADLRAGMPPARGGRINVGSRARTISNNAAGCRPILTISVRPFAFSTCLVFARAPNVETRGTLMWRSLMISRLRDAYHTALLTNLGTLSPYHSNPPTHRTRDYRRRLRPDCAEPFVLSSGAVEPEMPKIPPPGLGVAELAGAQARARPGDLLSLGQVQYARSVLAGSPGRAGDDSEVCRPERNTRYARAGTRLPLSTVAIGNSRWRPARLPS